MIIEEKAKYYTIVRCACCYCPGDEVSEVKEGETLYLEKGIYNDYICKQCALEEKERARSSDKH